MSLINQILSARREAKNEKALQNLPFSLSIQSLSEVDKMHRAENKEALQQFNKDVEKWGEDSVKSLRTSVKSLIKRDVLLSDSIRSNLYYDRQYAKEVNRVGFSFAREGIFIHKGARRGRGGYTGSSWIDRHGNRKSRAAESAGKQSGGIEWFDPVIETHLAQLADIVSEYSLTMQINATNLYIE